MTSEQKRVHERLMGSLPIRTHLRETQQKVDLYTGKPAATDGFRSAVHNRVVRPRVNTWLAPAPKAKR